MRSRNGFRLICLPEQRVRQNTCRIALHPFERSKVVARKRPETQLEEINGLFEETWDAPPPSLTMTLMPPQRLADCRERSDGANCGAEKLLAGMGEEGRLTPATVLLSCSTVSLRWH